MKQLPCNKQYVRGWHSKAIITMTNTLTYMTCGESFDIGPVRA